MAFLKLLIISTVLAIGAHAKFVWENDNGYSNFPRPRMPSQPNFPFQFAPFPPFPPSALFPPGFPNINFPNIPMPAMPVVPNPGQIKNVKPGPGQVFQGIAVQSSSSLVQDKDGKWVRKGGVAAISNNNGDVKEFSEGDAPDINVPLRVPTPLKLEFPKFPSFPEMKPLEFPKFPEMKPIEFPEFPKIKPMKFPEFKMPEIKPIDVDEMKTYTPKEGETYVGTASSSSSRSHTVNGKTVSEGAASTLVNDNGKVGNEHVAFRKGDKDFA